MEPHETPQDDHTKSALLFVATVAGLLVALMASGLKVFVPLSVLTALLGIGAYVVVREQFLRYRARGLRPPVFAVVLLLTCGVMYNPLQDQWDREHPRPREAAPAVDTSRLISPLTQPPPATPSSTETPTPAMATPSRRAATATPSPIVAPNNSGIITLGQTGGVNIVNQAPPPPEVKWQQVTPDPSGPKPPGHSVLFQISADQQMPLSLPIRVDADGPIASVSPWPMGGLTLNSGQAENSYQFTPVGLTVVPGRPVVFVAYANSPIKILSVQFVQ